MRNRIINSKGLYFDTELVNLLGYKGLHLYIVLWGIAEDWGGYEPKYEDISLNTGALKIKASEVEKYIGLMIKANKIFPYEANGKTYHWLANLLKHQPLNNPAIPKLPLPEWITCEIRQYGDKGGRKYACYSVDNKKLPVGYSLIETKGNEIKGNSKKAPHKILTDEQFIQSLKDNPAYKHININNEFGKMDAWLSINPSKQKTRRFILNWLNRVDKIVVMPKAQIKVERPMPINPEQQAEVADLIHKTAQQMKGVI